MANLILRANSAVGAFTESFNLPVTSGSLVLAPQNITLTDSGGVANLTHGASGTFTGSSFGTKATAAPHRWDNCDHGQSIATRWGGGNGGWPSGSGSSFNLAYRAGSFRSIGTPHPNVTNTLCGGTALNGDGTLPFDGTAGPNVIFGIDRTYSNGDVSYWSVYTRADPDWQNCGGDGDDDQNYKWFQAGGGSGWFDGNYWYLEHREPGIDPSDPVLSVHSSEGLYGGGTDAYGNTAINSKGTCDNPINGWLKIEIFIIWSTTSSGRVYCVVNNENSTPGSATRPGGDALGSLPFSKCAFWYSGPTLRAGTGALNEAFGGFNRDYLINGAEDPFDNFRYHNDIYMDRTWARVMLTNNATYTSSTIVEPQIITSWSDTSISATVNKGALSSGTVHVHVWDSTNTAQYLGTRTMT